MLSDLTGLLDGTLYSDPQTTHKRSIIKSDPVKKSIGPLNNSIENVVRYLNLPENLAQIYVDQGVYELFDW